MSKPESQQHPAVNAIEPARAPQPVDDGNLMAGSSLARHRGEIEDLLHSLPDRPDLERLYQRDIPLDQILQLLGHQVDSKQIDFLLRCADPRKEIRRILGTA
jgi:hypothetical protein